MKIKLQELLRWVLAPLLAACLLGWAGMALSDKLQEDKPAAHKQLEAPMAATAEDLQKAKDLLEELKARELENKALVLEGQRKFTDWWLGLLTVLTTIIAIGGAFIPFMMGRKNIESLELEKEKVLAIRNSAKEVIASIEKDMTNIKQTLNEAKEATEKAKGYEAYIKDRKDEIDGILNKYQSGQPDGKAEEVSKAVAAVQNDPASSDALKLRAKAIEASVPEQADKAYKLWYALTELDTTDASAHFNAGYWAQQLSTKFQGSESLHWLKQAKQHYSQALNLTPSAPASANNWGAALYAEAKIVAATDPVAAHNLWQQAGEKFRQALAIMPEYHEAAYNWGAALDTEAKAVAATDPVAAHNLWQQAGEKYQQALAIKPDKHEAAYNWGTALNAEAKAVAATDPVAAHNLWQQAGEKYRQVLAIMPENHEAANGWGSALLNEASALASTDAVQSRSLLDQAEQLLLKHAEAMPGVAAYNLACLYGLRGDAANCLKWLKIGQAHKTLPDCDHLKKDTDLDAIRNSSEFIEWFNTACPLDNK